jgi:hypothetical protein
MVNTLDNNSEGTTLPTKRVVLLGASNLTRGISTVLGTSRQLWGQRLDILAALGHGRSYGMISHLFGRSLPGIAQCGLWKALDERPAGPTVALITDVGNDILYGASVDQIMRWLEQCLDKLGQSEARIQMTELPTCNLHRISPRRFAILRYLLFPSSRLTLEQVAERAVELNERMTALANEHRVVLVPQRADWYSFDPIHIRSKFWPAAWKEILSGSLEPSASHDSAPKLDAPQRPRLRSLRPEKRWMWGVEQYHAQPCARLSGGTQLSLY